eukprot:CAMPEP_0116579738 /NCGR_PEP_ID=MMETSP0397-20121206/22411_1 /TAXON_ID=216820 /ORGANISM="Cyclophora tenuis, Strain ECT3854" /LENGTH=36 /DNA_ID= /DNA_START= /DNA_END= /DNA_ORIENTATION=
MTEATRKRNTTSSPSSMNANVSELEHHTGVDDHSFG